MASEDPVAVVELEGVDDEAQQKFLNDLYWMDFDLGDDAPVSPGGPELNRCTTPHADRDSCPQHMRRVSDSMRCERVPDSMCMLSVWSS